MIAIASAMIFAGGCARAPGDLRVKAVGADNPSCREVTIDGDRADAGQLIRNGRVYLDRALQRGRRSLLVLAGHCFRSVLVIKPGSYDAHLGLGVTHLGLAKHYHAPRLWKKDLLMAKRYLSDAYAMRPGAHEPIYLLAEIAAIEKKDNIAKELLYALIRAESLLGQAHTLLGFLHERAGDREFAVHHYEQAVLAGRPERSVVYALDHGLDLTKED